MEDLATTALKIITIGTSTGVILPSGMLDRLNVREGDALYAVETEDGSFRLTSDDPARGRKMAKAEEIMRRYENTLRVLAR